MWCSTLPGKIEMAIQAGADCGPAERELAQSFDRFLRARLRIRDLLRVAGEFLSESHRRRVHQMRAPDLDDVPEFFRLGFERARAIFPEPESNRFFNSSAALT